jgi:hypothetical protein
MNTPTGAPDNPALFALVAWPLFTCYRPGRNGKGWEAVGGSDSFQEAKRLAAERGADLVLPRGQRP